MILLSPQLRGKKSHFEKVKEKKNDYDDSYAALTLAGQNKGEKREGGVEKKKKGRKT